MKKSNVEQIEKAIWSVNKDLKLLESYIADDKNIKMDIEFSKIKLLEKKFYLLAELGKLKNNKE